jgi:hypothetical protein
MHLVGFYYEYKTIYFPQLPQGLKHSNNLDVFLRSHGVPFAVISKCLKYVYDYTII